MSKDRDYVLFLEDILESIGKIENSRKILLIRSFIKTKWL